MHASIDRTLPPVAVATAAADAAFLDAAPGFFAFVAVDFFAFVASAFVALALDDAPLVFAIALHSPKVVVDASTMMYYFWSYGSHCTIYLTRCIFDELVKHALVLTFPQWARPAG